MDGSGVPIRLRIYGGKYFAKLAQNPSLRQYIGDLRVMTSIPGGQPSGQFARAIGLAYAQIVREEEHRGGPPREITREMLLTRFPPHPTAQEILDTDHPERVKVYWSLAKRMLKDLGVWQDVKEPPVPAARYKKWDQWLKQVIHPEPGPLLASSVPTFPARARTAKPQRRFSRG